MKRRNLLKGLGAMGVGLPFLRSSSAAASAGIQRGREGSGVCWLTPQETEGPFYFDSNLVRQDIRTDHDTGEFHDGLPLNMTIDVIDIDCNPIPNVLVDIWHANKDGLYSGYVQPGGNTVGMDFMRGIQLTDASGRCSFITSYPGWYPGRTTHVHFKVRLSSTTYVTSQFAFLDSVNSAVYATPLYAGRGVNPTTNEEDSIFRAAEPEHQVMAVVPNATGYDGTYAIGIAGATGVRDEEDETPNEFTLRQNFPNPFNPVTTIEYYLPERRHVSLRVFDMLGNEVALLIDGVKTAGKHQTRFDGEKLSSGFYFYRLTATGEGSPLVSRGREMLLLK